MAVSTFHGSSSFTGGPIFAAQAFAYKQLLRYLVASGCILVHFDLRSEGDNKITLDYKVHGTYEQVKAFRDALRKDNGLNVSVAAPVPAVVVEVEGPQRLPERQGWVAER